MAKRRDASSVCHGCGVKCNREDSSYCEGCEYARNLGLMRREVIMPSSVKSVSVIKDLTN